MKSEAVNVRSLNVAARLLESDELSFVTTLYTEDSTLKITGAGNKTAMATMPVWWKAELETRTWGIKDVQCYATRLVLNGWFHEIGEDGKLHDTGETLHYEYPSTGQPVKQPEDDPDYDPNDPDAPTAASIDRYSRDNWEVICDVAKKTTSRTVFKPEAVVDIAARKIRITF